MPSFPPFLLACYKPVRVIGTGSFATVWQARSLASGQVVAVKILSEDHLTDTDAVTRFGHEARVGSRLRHPGILPVIEHDIVEGVPYLVTPLIAGPTLRQRMQDGPFPVRASLEIGIGIAAALFEIHRHGIVHRDLKPENILMPEPERPVLVDFGFAKSADLGLETGRGVVLGTVGYVAPELFEGLTSSPASDQYSLGVVLYELIVGRRPFARSSPADEVAARMTEEPIPPGSLRSEVAQIASDAIVRMLARQSRDRYQDLEHVRRALDVAARKLSRRREPRATDTLRLPIPPGTTTAPDVPSCRSIFFLLASVTLILVISLAILF